MILPCSISKRAWLRDIRALFTVTRFSGLRPISSGSGATISLASPVLGPSQVSFTISVSKASAMLELILPRSWQEVFPICQGGAAQGTIRQRAVRNLAAVGAADIELHPVGQIG